MLEIIVPMMCLLVSILVMTSDTMRIEVLLSLAIRGRFLNIRQDNSENEGNRRFGRKSKKEREIEKVQEWSRERGIKEVEITSFDGLNLKADYIEVPDANRTVILFHGWRGCWMKDFADISKWLYAQKSNLLLVNQRAHGKSEGKYIGFGVLERKDCLSWIHYADQLSDKKLPIYLLGISMGASTVLMSTGEKLPETVKGVIADCGFTTPYDMVFRAGKKMLHIGQTTMDRVNQLCKKKANYDFSECSTLETVAECQIPILFVHGKDDRFVPCEMTIENYERCNGRKRLLLIDHADHEEAFKTDKEKYVRNIVDFFHWQVVA